MSADIVTFPPQLRAIETADPAPKFHCAQQVVTHCFTQMEIACSGDLARLFVDEMEKAGYAMVPYWLLNNLPGGPAA